MSSITTRIREIFNEQFSSTPTVFRSPGRINLIGEHTDYNMGFVLPAAIDKAVYIAIAARLDNKISLYAGDLQQVYHTTTDSLRPSGLQWPDFMLGVVDQLQKAGHTIQGFEAVLMGDVPLGAGLSSSAAVECATAFALDRLFGLQLTRLEMVKTAQKAENDFVGVKCGIMDQFASMFGKTGKVIRLDCRSLDYEYIPFETDSVKIVLFDTGVKHSLASSEYNLRRKECEEGVRLISQTYPQVRSLRDADMRMVNECLAMADEKIVSRCTYVVEEIQRLQDACDDLVNQDLAGFGRKMFETHDGLSRLYEVSCPEADALVNWVKNKPGVYGARMMGGGFGGCTINIVDDEAIPQLVTDMEQLYLQAFNQPLKHYVVRIEEGTSQVQ